MLKERRNNRPTVQPWTIVASVILGLALSKNIDFLAGLPPWRIHFVSIIHFTVILIVGNRITLYFWRKNIQKRRPSYGFQTFGGFVSSSTYQGIRDAIASALVYGLAVSISQAWVFFPLMTVLFCLLLADSLAQGAALFRPRQGSLILLVAIAFPDFYMVLLGAYMSIRGKGLSGIYMAALAYTIMTAIYDLWNRPRVLERLLVSNEKEYFREHTHFETPTGRAQ
jgi:hypothetical protein